MRGSSEAPKEIHHKTPFRSPLVDAGFHNNQAVEDIMYLKSDPEKIVRVSPYESREERSFEKLQVYQAVLHELRDGYGLKIAPVQIVIGSNPENDNPYTRDTMIPYLITDRIHGKTLRDIEFKPGEAKDRSERLDPLFAALTQYYWDKANGKGLGFYFGDLANGNQQFVWGRKKEEKEDDIYLVDVGLNQWPLPEHEPWRRAQLFFPIYGAPDSSKVEAPRSGVYYDLLEMEAKLGNIKLEKARVVLADFFSDFLAKTDENDIIFSPKRLMAERALKELKGSK